MDKDRFKRAAELETKISFLSRMIGDRNTRMLGAYPIDVVDKLKKIDEISEEKKLQIMEQKLEELEAEFKEI